jgi:hypothetical protein
MSFSNFFPIFINMGRKRKYFTEEEKRIAKNESYMRFYEKNKERIRKEKLKRYYETKRN